MIYTPEVRRDVELPYVTEGERRFASRTAELFDAQWRLFAIPGFGMRVAKQPPEVDLEIRLRKVNARHQGHIRDAAARLGFMIDRRYAPDSFFSPAVNSEVGMHVDDIRVQDFGLGIHRTHTNGTTPVDVTLVNARTYGSIAGDQKTSRYVPPFGFRLNEVFRNGDFDPCLSDSTFYHLRQPPYASTMSRRGSSLGGPSGHGFRTLQHTGLRQLVVSDFGLRIPGTLLQ